MGGAHGRARLLHLVRALVGRELAMPGLWQRVRGRVRCEEAAGRADDGPLLGSCGHHLNRKLATQSPCGCLAVYAPLQIVHVTWAFSSGPIRRARR